MFIGRIGHFRIRANNTHRIWDKITGREHEIIENHDIQVNRLKSFEVCGSRTGSDRWGPQVRDLASSAQAPLSHLLNLLSYPSSACRSAPQTVSPLPRVLEVFLYSPATDRSTSLFLPTSLHTVAHEPQNMHCSRGRERERER